MNHSVMVAAFKHYLSVSWPNAVLLCWSHKLHGNGDLEGHLDSIELLSSAHFIPFYVHLLHNLQKLGHMASIRPKMKNLCCK